MLFEIEFMADILGVLNKESLVREVDLNSMDLVSFCNLNDCDKAKEYRTGKHIQDKDTNEKVTNKFNILFPLNN